MWRELQRRQRCRASHKADDRPLDRGRQTEPGDELQIEARRGEAGARGDDEMSDVRRPRRKAEIRHRPARQWERLAIVARHPRRRVGERPEAVEAFVVYRARVAARRQRGVAMHDLTAIGHTPEQAPLALVGEITRRDIHELPMNIVPRDRPADPVYECRFPHSSSIETKPPWTTN